MCPDFGNLFMKKLTRERVVPIMSASVLGRVSDMGLGYDIFKKLDDGSPVWVGQADSLAGGQKALESLRRASPGYYFLRDADSGAVIPDSDPRKT
jgi:hypothetical protein